MSVAEAVAVDAAPKKKLSKKLVIVIVGVVLLLAAAGGGALLWMKARAAQEAAHAAESDEGETAAQEPAAKPRSGTPPTFVPIDQFTVNLADKDAERFVQVAMTLEVDDAKLSEQIKLYMPVIRNGVLMVLAHKTSAELLERAGKMQLAREVQKEVALAIGGDTGADNPVRHVHFSHFIIQ